MSLLGRAFEAAQRVLLDPLVSSFEQAAAAIEFEAQGYTVWVGSDPRSGLPTRLARTRPEHHDLLDDGYARLRPAAELRRLRALAQSSPFMLTQVRDTLDWLDSFEATERAINRAAAHGVSPWFWARAETLYRENSPPT